MKRLLSMFAMILIVSVMLSFSCFAEEKAAIDGSELVCEVNDGTRAYIHYTKTVVRTYTSLASIPTSIPYSEYNNTLNGWFSGTLYFVSCVKVGNLYEATFTGEIYGNA